MSYSGAYYSAVDARTLPGPVQQPRPPLIVAANGPRALRLAARYGDGWATTGAYTPEDQEAWWRSVEEAADRFSAALSAAGRDGVDRYLNLDSSALYSLSSVGAFEDAIGRAAALGFTDVLTHWPRASSWYAGSEKVLEKVAGLLPGLRETFASRA